MKKVLSLIFVLIMLTSCVSMPAGAAKAKKYIKSVTISSKTLTLTEKSSKTVKVSVKVVKNASKKFTVKVSNKSIVTAKVSGTKVKLTAKKKGKAVVTVTTSAKGKKGKKLSAKLTVTVKQKSYNANADIALDASDGGALITGESEGEITLKLDSDSQNIKVEVLNSADRVVYTKIIKSAKKSSVQKIDWTPNNSGTYYIRVTAGKTVTKSDTFTVYPQEFEGGTGSVDNPFQIATADQFKIIEKYNGYNFIQTADIDFDAQTIKGFFNSNDGFTGNYNGDGHKISNMIMANQDKNAAALFYIISKKSTVENLTITNTYVTGKNDCAVLCSTNYGKIYNINIDDCHVTSVDTDGYSDGAILVDSNETGSKISNCTITNSTLSVKSDGWNDSKAGGIAAHNSGTVSDCSIKKSEISLGGVKDYAGSFAAWNAGNIINCTADEVNLIHLDKYYDYTAGMVSENVGIIKGCAFLNGSVSSGNTGVYFQNGTLI